MEQSLTASWTDDLPVCRQSGIGISPNEVYKKDGRRSEMHPNEDRSFHFSVDEFGVRVYGVFDGFNGLQVSDFAAKKLPAELCLGQVSKHSTDEAVREALRNAFVYLDREYFNYIGEKLALRMAKRLQQDHCKQDPDLLQLDLETLTGASATCSILLDNAKLFIANAGDVRAVVCSKKDDDIKAIPLSVDHLIDNEDEALRLGQLGLDVDKVGHLTYKTRCLGFHQGKGGYKEVDFLKAAQDEPILGCPEIHGPFSIESHHLFMIIFTSPLAKCLEQIQPEIQDVNVELCRITKEQFAENNTVSGVAQSVVDKIVRMHRDHFETEIDDLVEKSWRREDISLLVRNFNCKLANSKRQVRTSSSNLNNLDSTTMIVTSSNAKEAEPNNAVLIPHEQPTRSSTTTESSDNTFVKQTDRELSVDENGRIKPYVDFSYFHKHWQDYKIANSLPNGTSA